MKSVPLFYMPVFYYPDQQGGPGDRLSDSLYGTSTIRGQSISNAFFWAINRSHDATFLHDWFSKTGQGAGGDYRYRSRAGSHSAICGAYISDEHETTYTDDDGKR